MGLEEIKKKYPIGTIINIDKGLKDCKWYIKEDLIVIGYHFIKGCRFILKVNKEFKINTNPGELKNVIMSGFVDRNLKKMRKIKINKILQNGN